MFFKWPIKSFPVRKLQNKSLDVVVGSRPSLKDTIIENVNRIFSNTRSKNCDQDMDLYSVSYKEKLTDDTAVRSSTKSMTKNVGFSDSTFPCHTNNNTPSDNKSSMKSFKSRDSYDNYFPASLSFDRYPTFIDDEDDDEDEDEYPLHQYINPLYSHNTSSKSLSHSKSSSKSLGYAINESKFNSYDEYDNFEDKLSKVNLNNSSTFLTAAAEHTKQRIYSHEDELYQDRIEMRELSG